MKITDIIKESGYNLTQFSDEQIAQLENTITVQTIKGKTTYNTICVVRKKTIKLTPEEVVRQLFLLKLLMME